MFIKKFKENYSFKSISLYVIFGILTTLINIITFKVLMDLNIQYMFSNVVAFIVSVIFAYVTNRKWVFYSKINTKFQVIEEFLKFLISRITTFLFDFFGMIFMIEVLRCGKLNSKMYVNIVVVILNYLISKNIVFKSLEEK